MYFASWVRFPWSLRSLVNEVIITRCCYQFCPQDCKIYWQKELNRQLPPRKVKDTNISEIENTSCVRNVMEVNPVSGIERKPWGASCILIRVNDGVLICTCTVQYYEYNFWGKHAFFFTVISNLCINQNVVGFSLIIELMHLFVFWRIKKEQQRKIWDMPLNNYLVVCAMWNMYI